MCFVYHILFGGIFLSHSCITYICFSEADMHSFMYDSSKQNNHIRYMSIYFCVVCFITKHFWLIHFIPLHMLYEPYLGLCQATCVQYKMIGWHKSKITGLCGKSFPQALEHISLRKDPIPYSSWYVIFSYYAYMITHVWYNYITAISV